MFLASAKDELICDFAETYRIYDIYSLPVPTLATLAAGLRDTSRARMKISKNRISTDTMLLAIIADRLGLLCWIESGSAHAKKERPASILDILEGRTNKNGAQYRVFSSPEEFERERKRVIDNGN